MFLNPRPIFAHTASPKFARCEHYRIGQCSVRRVPSDDDRLEAAKKATFRNLRLLRPREVRCLGKRQCKQKQTTCPPTLHVCTYSALGFGSSQEREEWAPSRWEAERKPRAASSSSFFEIPIVLGFDSVTLCYGLGKPPCGMVYVVPNGEIDNVFSANGMELMSKV